MRKLRRTASVMVLLLVVALATGCMGFVTKRSPRIPKSERNPAIENAPRILLEFECEVQGEPESPSDPCLDQREKLDKVVREFSFLAHSSWLLEDYDYRLRVRVEVGVAESILPPCGSEAWGYTLGMIPCYDKERLETSAELFSPDGRAMAEGQSAATRTTFGQTAMVFVLPAAIPTAPAALRFSTNTYRNLLAQIGKSLVALPGGAQAAGKEEAPAVAGAAVGKDKGGHHEEGGAEAPGKGGGTGRCSRKGEGITAPGR